MGEGKCQGGGTPAVKYEVRIDVDVSKEAVAERELLGEPEAVLRLEDRVMIQEVIIQNPTPESCIVELIVRLDSVRLGDKFHIPPGGREIKAVALLERGQVGELWVSPRGAVSSVTVVGEKHLEKPR